MASENGHHRGLLVDYGGVLTSNLFDSFRAFCELEGIEPGAVGDRFRSDPECRRLLIGLETGKLPERDFEVAFAEVLGVQSRGLIDRLFAGSQPDETMLAAVQRARSAGIRTGPGSNSWGTRRHHPPRPAPLFDGALVSGEGGDPQPSPGSSPRGVG